MPEQHHIVLKVFDFLGAPLHYEWPKLAEVNLDRDIS